MRFALSLLVAALLVVTFSLPAVATQSESDTIDALLSQWGHTNMNYDISRDALVDEAIALHADTIPGSACQAYTDFVVTAILINDAVVDQGAAQSGLGISTVTLIGSQLTNVAEACRISV